MFIESIEQLHRRLREYIEAVYHISDERLLDDRSAVLDDEGVLRQPPFIESTRSYKHGPEYADLLCKEPPELLALAQKLSKREKRILHDPPYLHQGQALSAMLGDEDRHIVVYTGTGSGKTECFTIPTLMRLYREAVAAPESFSTRATRAIVLYPMNALVNDQLGRIRNLLGDDDVAEAFKKAARRPVTFGQYTGRTPFAGYRTFTSEGDGRKIKSFGDFYIKTVEKRVHDGDASAIALRSALEAKGRWPKKRDLLAWFGPDRATWDRRLHPDPNDREMIARHEFYGYRVNDVSYGAPPDVLITNYSMLEFMLMRPIERSIFDRTRDWLAQNREQKLFLVLDEAHLYRGAQGTEVALLIRRLMERLDLARADRRSQLRVAITSASFSGGERAREFASELVGRPAASFMPIAGELAIVDTGAAADGSVARALATLDVAAFYGAPEPGARLDVARPALAAISGAPLLDVASSHDDVAAAAHRVLVNSPLRRRLVSQTQQAARQLDELAAELFSGVSSDEARRATEALAVLCAVARPAPTEANLLPSRIHTFHRGLPGLWCCINPGCVGVAEPGAHRVAGKIYAQPRDRCDACDARVFQLFTCRSCGAAYARAGAVKEELNRPTFLWSGGKAVASDNTTVLPIDVLLQVDRANAKLVEYITVDTITGQVVNASDASRQVGLYRIDPARKEPLDDEGRLFFRCGVCEDDNDDMRGNEVRRRSPVEDHQTEGQDPFHALITSQISSQPARATKPQFLKKETPLAGRKVLIFSDGRQKAARLAADLGRAALRDSIRPLVLRGFESVEKFTLANAYQALLVGAAERKVELRATDEKFDAHLARDLKRADDFIKSEYDFEDADLMANEVVPPEPVATLLLRVIRDKHTGLSALALGRFIAVKRANRLLQERLEGSAHIPPEWRDPIVGLWLSCFVEQKGATVFPAEKLEPGSQWLAASEHAGAFDGVLTAVAAAWGPPAKEEFRARWLPALRDAFRSHGEDEGATKIHLSANRVRVLSVDGDSLASWGRCSRCSAVQPVVLPKSTCVHCKTVDVIERLETGASARVKFEKRKGFYRAPVLSADPPRPLVAREHSAALTGVTGDVQSRAERHELAFQDITAADIDGMRSPIDVLSCTTTMEVGIDIGDLAAVALRNMPPGRANYQQRAGRAGRRGNAIATVLAYADQDGHNQHSFENPRRLIKESVPDPTLNLQNARIARRHVNAYVLQQFLSFALNEPTPTGGASLMASLGTIGAFLAGGSPVNLRSLREWLARGAVVADLRAAIDRWLPTDVLGREQMLSDFAAKTLAMVEQALRVVPESSPEPLEDDQPIESDDDEVASNPNRSLLDRLLFEGVLPKYAFPTDLVAFHVFEATNGLNNKPSDVRQRVRYAPQRALSLALSEYAPGRTVFIDGRGWVSSALFSPITGAVPQALADAQQTYFRYCEVCGYAETGAAPTGTGSPCRACGDEEIAQRPGVRWLTPPGFAHAVTSRPRTEPDAERYSRPGRAVLFARSPSASQWTRAEGRPGVASYLNQGDDEQWDVLITNRGPRDHGFRVCDACHAIEAIHGGGRLLLPHKKPVPSPQGWSEDCRDPQPHEPVYLGTRMRTDILLLRFQLPEPQRLSPGVRVPVFQMALSSLATALSLAASMVLEIESGEVIAGYRPGFSDEGPDSRFVEVFLYDQLAGGAGYVVELSRQIDRFLRATRAILGHEPWESRTPQAPCDRACYGCLLSFKNSYEHGALDRNLALDLLDAASTGTPAKVDDRRGAAAYGLLRRWASTMGVGEVMCDVETGPAGDATRAALAIATKSGARVIPALFHPFSQGEPDDPVLSDMINFPSGGDVVAPLNYLDVARALPAAVESLRKYLP